MSYVVKSIESCYQPVHYVDRVNDGFYLARNVIYHSCEDEKSVKDYIDSIKGIHNSITVFKEHQQFVKEVKGEFITK